ncbi:hypothetical protein [Burkholderia cepacia]|uniref:hypothetical protein n=1 Tax=Burkholderia cepacia TaxID=292 RepID=UPI00398F3697
MYPLVFTDGSMPMPGVEPVFRIHSSLRLASEIMAILSERDARLSAARAPGWRPPAVVVFSPSVPG